MSPEEPTRQRSSVRLARNTKQIQPEVHVYNDDTDMTAAVAAAKAAFGELDAFAKGKGE